MKTPLTPQEADRVFDLVAEAGALEPEQRTAFLAQACAGAEGLRAEVESLLGFKNRVPQFLASPAFGRGVELLGFSAGDDLKPGDTLGDYRVLSLLGSGGMGEVYLADDAVHGRQVALKLIGQGRVEEVRGRHFRHERKVLATLNHPHIARLYGSGVTGKGQAYLVMEYVEGERLDRYCDLHGLGVNERLALFRKVCAAVSYAHQNLVVHRDLKPANIRVTPEGEPKLLDFGIAKLLDPEGTTNRLDPTLTMQGAMTPEYASPEQIKGEPITTASDVYTLGVVLFELLTGQRPYAHLKSCRPDELARAICEDEPPRPSTVAGRTNPAPSPATRSAEQARVSTSTRYTTLCRQLEGDLDNIVAKALQKEPGRRYPSAAAFSEDLRRHSDGLPVIARRDTLGYRAGKFVRRNKAAVVTAAAIVLALVGGLVAMIRQTRVAEKERDHARAAQERAETAQQQSELARRQAERLNGFLQTLLSSANPESGPGRDLKVVQVLDQASSSLDQELAGEPALLAQAHQTIGQAYTALQVAEPALNHLRASLEINERVYGDDNIVTARAKAALGAALSALTRRSAEAEPLLRQALAVERRQPPAEQSKLPAILVHEAIALSQLDRIGEAKTTVAEYLALTRQANGEQNVTYVDRLLQLANLSLAQIDNAAAESLYRQAAAILRRLRPQTPSFASVLTNLAYVLILEGKLDEPEGLLQEARELDRRVVGEQNISFALTVGCLAWLHFLQADYPRAEEEMRTSQAIAHAVGIPDGEQDNVGGRVLLALAMTRNGKASAAEGMLRESLGYANTNHLIGNASPDYITLALGECLLAQNRYAEAEPLLLTSHDNLEKQLGSQNRQTIEATHRLHDLYLAWNKPAEAARFAGDAMTPPSPTP